MSAELKTLVDDMQATWHEFKAKHAEESAEIAKLGEATTETKQTVDRLQNALDAVEVKMTKAIESLGSRSSSDDSWKDKPEAKAFEHFLRGSAVPDEMKAQLQVGDDSAGGFLAPADYLREIIKGEVEITPFRTVARVMETTATSRKIPKRTGNFAASWTASAGTRAETTGQTYGMEEIPTHELYARVDIENQLLEDAAFDVFAELGPDMIEQFALAEGTAFVTGSGVGRPEGFITKLTTTLETATNDTFVADDLISLYFELKEPYASRGTWIMNRAVLKAVRKFKETSTDNYLWQPGLAGLAPATILDRPYILSPDMATGVTTDAAKVVAFGDWRRAYYIVDRINLQIQRDPFTQAYSGATVFHARRRVGGQVVNTEAAKVLEIN